MLTHDTDDHYIYLHAQAGGTFARILQGQGWRWSVLRECWKRGNNAAGRKSLDTIREMTGFEIPRRKPDATQPSITQPGAGGRSQAR